MLLAIQYISMLEEEIEKLQYVDRIIHLAEINQND